MSLLDSGPVWLAAGLLLTGALVGWWARRMLRYERDWRAAHESSERWEDELEARRRRRDSRAA